MGTVLLLKPLCRFFAATSAGIAGLALLRVSAFEVKTGGIGPMGQRQSGQRLIILCTRFTARAFHPLNDLLAAVYLIFFALIAGGAFALMSQNLRGSASLATQRSGGKPRRHPEAPEPGDEVLYVDFSRERLEELYQQAS